MLLRILKNSFIKRPRAILLVILSITMGATVATAFIGIQLGISSKMALELRKYGANILVEPAAGVGAYLRENDLPRIKTVFWKHNITAFAPYLFGVAELSANGKRERGILAGTWFNKRLQVEGEEPSAQGVRATSPWWSLTGSWPAANDDALIGAALARRLGIVSGGYIVAGHQGKEQRFRVAGIVTTGGYEEEQLFAPLATVQAFLGLEGKVSRILVSALTVPMDDFGRKEPATMSKLDYEKWYCTAYVTSVARNIEEVIAGGRAKPIWQVAGAEGALLGKLNMAMVLLTIIALVAASFGVSTSLMASIAERRREIALMKAIGADRLQIAAVFVGEAVILSLVGGFLGYLLGNRLAELISRTVFESPLHSSLWLLPIAIGSSLAVALIGSAAPLCQGLMIEPVKVLRK